MSKLLDSLPSEAKDQLRKCSFHLDGTDAGNADIPGLLRRELTEEGKLRRDRDPKNVVREKPDHE